MIRLGGGNWSTLSNTSKYSVLLASSDNASAAGAQPGRSLMYSCGTNMPPDAGSASCGVSYADAVANNWILKDASGNYVHYRGQYPVLLDIGNPSFQQNSSRTSTRTCALHPGIDGVWIDDIVGLM